MWRRDPALAFATLIVASACGPGGASGEPAGAELYAATCAACHGEAEMRALYAYVRANAAPG